ncbi:MAG: Glyoxalase/Bleomycin resistance protein/Dioxygenase superfamily protein [Chloroflexi bacterium]|jgi:catechol 2,3-dioxygenase-like lactoylglutathione lyase family enzyme|nr:MAG: Glyoxalase/Bleomycin resistance protein/Dioxygenase superfamily protein [Chloroflexota bacterium]
MAYLDHTIVPSHDKEASAKFIAKIFGLEYKGPWGPFAPVKFNETLSMDFGERPEVHHNHYAFIVTDEEFDAIFQRIKDEGIPYGSGPRSVDDMQINHLYEGRGFYFPDANGHTWEVITHTYV